MRVFVATLALIALALSAGYCQDEDVLYANDFENGLGELTTMDPDAELAVTKAADVVFQGKQSVELWFLQRGMDPDIPDQGVPGSLVVPRPEGLAGLETISFAIAVAHSTPIVVILGEGDEGPRFNRTVWIEAGDWWEVSLKPDEFQHDINSPGGPDAKLDPARVTSVALIDLAVFIRQFAKASDMLFLPVQVEQTIWLDDFKLVGAPPAEKAGPDRLVINDYSTPLHGVAFIGGDSVTVAAEPNDAGESQVRIDYSVPSGTLFAMIHQVPHGLPQGTRTISLRLKSPNGASLVMNLEEQTGKGDENKRTYSHPITVPASPDWQTISLPLSEFAIGEDGIDPNGKLDPEYVQMVMLGDTGAIANQTDVTGILYLDELAATK